MLPVIYFTSFPHKQAKKVSFDLFLQKIRDPKRERAGEL